MFCNSKKMSWPDPCKSLGLDLIRVIVVWFIIASQVLLMDYVLLAFALI